MQIAIADAKARLAALIRRVEAGEEIELTRYGRPVAKLVAPHAGRKTGAVVGCMKGRFEAPDDVHAGDDEVEALFTASQIDPR